MKPTGFTWAEQSRSYCCRDRGTVPRTGLTPQHDFPTTLRNASAVGTLQSVDWRNPHIFVTVAVSNDEVVETWTFEGPPPAFFRNRALTKLDFERALGNTVTVDASPARNASKAGWMRQIALPDREPIALLTAAPRSPNNERGSNSAREGRRATPAPAFDANAMQLVIFDRKGSLVRRINDRAAYSQPTLSPDGTHLAVIEENVESSSRDLWVFDLVAGDWNRITVSQPGEQVFGPVWSPDGRALAYVALRGDSSATIARLDGNRRGVAVSARRRAMARRLVIGRTILSFSRQTWRAVLYLLDLNRRRS
jgi:hypothetical protein